MKKLAVSTALAVLVHAVIVVWHLFVLAKIPPALTGQQALSAPESNGPSSAMQGKLSLQTGFSPAPKEKGVTDLVRSWCSAYRQSNPERLAALEMTEVEIVDRFGDWHHLTGLRDRERFWREGFDMIRTKDFRPACGIEHVRLIRLDVAIVQASVSYTQGISLKGSDLIPPFSEIHTFLLMKSDDTWLISAQDIVQHISLK